MPKPLEPRPFAALFPELLPEEFSLLVRDIKERGQLELIILRALARIKAILGNCFYAEVKARNLIQKPEEIVHLAKLTDAQIVEIGSLLKRVDLCGHSSGSYRATDPGR